MTFPRFLGRVDLLSKPLSASLGACTPEQLRRVQLLTAEFAVGRTGLSHQLVELALTGLRQGRPVDSKTRAGLTALLEKLDETQFDLSDKAERGEVPKVESDRAWSHARAASAVLFALEADPLTAPNEGLYEAYHATMDLPALEMVVARIRSGDL